MQIACEGLVNTRSNRRLLRQKHFRLRIFHHVLEPLRRIPRIQRHIRPSRFQDPQQPHYHLQRALHTIPTRTSGPTPSFRR